MAWIPYLLLGFGLLAGAVFTGSLYLIWWNHYSERSQRVEKRLEILAEFSKKDRPAKLKERRLSQWFWLHQQLQIWPRAAQIDHFLLRSGLSLTVSDVLLLTLVGGLLPWWLLFFFDIGLLSQIFGVALGGYVPWLILRVMTSKRQKNLEEQLPDVLDFIARAMLAGHAFNSALQMAAIESPQPIAGEFQQTFNQVNIGMPIQQAMSGLAERIDCADMRYFAVSVVINREVGGDLAGLLTGLAALIRERLKLRLLVKSLTAEARASTWVIGLLPFLIGATLLLLNPSYLDPLLSDPMGRKMLIYGFLMMVVGLVMMSRLSRVRA